LQIIIIKLNPMTLLDLAVAQVFLGSHGQGLATRLKAMGISPRKPIRVLRKAWLGDSLHIQVGSTTEIAIRRQEARNVLIQQHH
jgi:ferrous iron transport protein A